MTATATGTAPRTSVLTDELLERFRVRAPQYDRDNRFFDEDFAELRDAGYLTLAVPSELGGGGLSLAEYGREARRLARYAPATALGTNMHMYWTGVAADLYRAGDTSLQWLLEEAMAGEVFAAGHAETGNDIPLLLSTCVAERVDGGYRFTGRKSFGSLTPVWTRLGLHAMDASDPAAPKIVHAFMPRDTPGARIEETWDALGMRATRSDDTVLDGAEVPDRYIGRVIPAGAAGMDLFVLGVFAWADVAFANIYYGLAERVLGITVENVKQKTSLGISRGSLAYHAEYQHRLAEMVMTRDAIEAQLDAVADGWSADILDTPNWDAMRGPTWAARIVSMKHNVAQGVFRMADTAIDLAGGFGIARRGEFERLFRDARLARIHPANPMTATEIVAKVTLGVDLDAQPRWG